MVALWVIIGTALAAGASTLFIVMPIIGLVHGNWVGFTGWIIATPWAVVGMLIFLALRWNARHAASPSNE